MFNDSVEGVLEEEVIPEADNQLDDDELDDVVVVDVSYESDDEEVSNVDNNFINNLKVDLVELSEDGSIISSDQGHGYELEEEVIPESHNALDDDELDDIMIE